jgi:hypothetical protein
MSLRVDSPPPPADLAEDPHGGGGHDWVRLHRAENDIDAALLVGKLSDAAIETRTLKDRGAPGAWLYGGSNPWAPVEIFVRRFQLNDAIIVLAEVSLNLEAHADDERPTERGERRWRIPAMWWATALTLGIALTALAIAQVTHTTGFCQLPVLCERQSVHGPARP